MDLTVPCKLLLLSVLTIYSSDLARFASTQSIANTPRNVKLDIKSDKSSTSEYYYSDDRARKNAVYTCRSGYGFSSVSHNNVSLWNAAGNERANEVVVDGIGKNEKTVTLYFPDGDNKVFSRSWSGRLWSEIQVQLPAPDYDVSEVKVTTVGMDGTSKENYTTRYKIKKVPGKEHYEFTFNPYVECAKIEHDGREVWRRENDPFGDSNPRSFSYDKPANTFVIQFESGSTSYRLDDNGQWVIASSTMPLEPSQHPQEVKVTTGDTDGTSQENDPRRYKVYKRDNIYTYKFNQDVKCTMITHDDNEVWKHETFLLGTESDSVSENSTDTYPLSFTYSTSDKIITLKFVSGSTSYIFNSDSRLWELLAGPREVKVTTKDSDGAMKENDPTKYKVYKKIGLDTFTYKFNPRVECTKITHERKEVWRHITSDSGGSDSNPDSFTYNKTDNTFLLFFGLEYIKFTLDGTTSTWKGGERESIIKLTTQSSGGVSENGIARYGVLVEHGRDSYISYKFYATSKCTSITHLGNKVWSKGASSSDDLDFFTYNRRDNELTLWFGLEYIKFSLDSGTGSWERGKILETTLDIESDKRSTTEFDYLHNNETKSTSYTCKEEFGFTLVRQGGTQIWKAKGSNGRGPTITPTTDNINAFAHGVTLSNPASDMATLTFHFLDGTKRVFKKSSRDQQWREAKQTGSFPLDKDYLPKTIISPSTTHTHGTNQFTTETTHQFINQTISKKDVKVTYTVDHPEPTDASQPLDTPLHYPTISHDHQGTNLPVDLATHTPLATPTDTHTHLSIDTGDGKMVTIGSTPSARPTEIILKEGKGMREVRLIYSSVTHTTDVTHDLTGDESGHSYGGEDYEYSSDDLESYTYHSGEALPSQVEYSDHTEDVHLHSDTDVHVHGDPAKRGTAPVPSRGRRSAGRTPRPKQPTQEGSSRQGTSRQTHMSSDKQIPREQSKPVMEHTHTETQKRPHRTNSTRPSGQPKDRVTGQPSGSKGSAQAANPRKKTGGGHSATRATHPRQTNR